MDRENVIKIIEEEISICELVNQSYRTIDLPVLRNILILLKDQLEIVRCKDCVNCIKEPNGELYCDVLAIGYEPFGSKKVTEYWFCADGKRRDSDG